MNEANKLNKDIRKAKEKLDDTDPDSVEYKMKHKAIREMEKQKRAALHNQTGVKK